MASPTLLGVLSDDNNEVQAVPNLINLSKPPRAHSEPGPGPSAKFVCHVLTWKLTCTLANSSF